MKSETLPSFWKSSAQQLSPHCANGVPALGFIQIQKAVKVVMLLTLVAYLSILRANYGQWMSCFINVVMLFSYPH